MTTLEAVLTAREMTFADYDRLKGDPSPGARHLLALIDDDVEQIQIEDRKRRARKQR